MTAADSTQHSAANVHEANIANAVQHAIYNYSGCVSPQIQYMHTMYVTRSAQWRVR
jgi:hypothetical protein